MGTLVLIRSHGPLMMIALQYDSIRFFRKKECLEQIGFQEQLKLEKFQLHCKSEKLFPT